MAEYELKIRVLDKNLPTILQVLDGAAEIVNLTVVDPKAVTATGVKKKRRFRYKGGKRSKGISGADLIRKTVKGVKGASRDVLNRAFKVNGFAASSCSAVLSTLIKSKEVVYDADSGVYKLAK